MDGPCALVSRLHIEINVIGPARRPALFGKIKVV